MEIEIHGLTRKQTALADIIWACDSKENVESFINSLQGDNKKEAQTVFELMSLAVWDSIEEIEPAITDLINTYK
jgi:hypothetical protein